MLCADIRFTLSQICWSVGVLVTDGRCSDSRVPGGSVHPSSVSGWSENKIKSYQSSQEPTGPSFLGISRPGNPKEVEVRSVHHLHVLMRSLSLPILSVYLSSLADLRVSDRVSRLPRESRSDKEREDTQRCGVSKQSRIWS